MSNNKRLLPAWTSPPHTVPSFSIATLQPANLEHRKIGRATKNIPRESWPTTRHTVPAGATRAYVTLRPFFGVHNESVALPIKI